MLLLFVGGDYSSFGTSLASWHLRCLSGGAPLVLVAITEEIYVLLLSTSIRPP